MYSGLTHDGLNSIDLRVLTIQRSEVGRWWNFKNVINPFSRLWLVMGGRAVVAHHGRNFSLQPGQLHLVPALTVHDCSCSKSFDYYHLHFGATQATGIDPFSLLNCEYQIEAPVEALSLLKRLELIYPDRKLPHFDPRREEYNNWDPGSAAPDGALKGFEAKGILALLLSEFLKSSNRDEGVHARVTRQFLTVQEFIHDNMHRQVSLAELAEVAGLNPTYFSDQFTRIVGVRPLAYLTRRRIEKAQYLLLSSRAPVKEIADTVGIPDPAYFSRVFARLCKTSPTEYRSARPVLA